MSDTQTKTQPQNNAGADSVVWNKLFSEKGDAYQVGKLQEEINEEGKADKEDKIELRSKNDFTIQVDWPVGENKWINTSDEVRNVAAIIQYKLYRNPPNHMYSYRLEFRNTEHYDYHFYDDEGDNYRNNTFANSIHYVEYNSKDPRIYKIRGD